MVSQAGKAKSAHATSVPVSPIRLSIIRNAPLQFIVNSFRLYCRSIMHDQPTDGNENFS